jgi:cell division protein FtsN
MNRTPKDAPEEVGQLPKKDYFWAIIAAGVIVVGAGAWFLGNFIAGKIVNKSTTEIGEITTMDSDSPVDLPMAATDASRGGHADRASDAAKKDATGKTDIPEKTQVEIVAERQPDKQDSAKSTDDRKPSGGEDEPDKAPQYEPPRKPAPSLQPEAADMEGKTEKQVPPETTKPKPAGKTIYVLQLGVYDSKENADRMKKNLIDEYGLEAYVGKVDYDGVIKYRVQLGAFTDKANAQKMGRELQLKGYNYYIAEKTVE